MFNLIKTSILLFLITSFFSFSYAENKLGYIDIDSILNKSIASKSLFNQLKNIETKKFKELAVTEKKLKEEENKILSSKNILSNDEYNKNVSDFKKKIANYQKKKKDTINNLKNKRKNEILRFMKLINPLIEEVMSDNSVEILIEKKNIFIAKSNYDITQNIIDSINKNIKIFNITND